MNRADRVTRGISFQLIALLSVVLLPVGAISVAQSLSIARDARRSVETQLLRLTGEYVAIERRQIEAGIKEAKRLATQIAATPDRPHACGKLLTDFIAGQPLFSFAGFVDATGEMRCVSQGSAQDFSQDPHFLRPSQNPDGALDRVTSTSADDSWAMMITQPVLDHGKGLGFVAVAVPPLGLPHLADSSDMSSPLGVFVVNAAGDVLASAADTAKHLPAPATFQGLLDGPEGVFTGAGQSGEKSTFAKVVLVPGIAYAIGEWPMDNPITRSEWVVFKAMLFPMLMWGASLLIAFMAATRLVVRPIQALREAMQRFTRGERGISISLASGAPLELHEVVGTFNKLELIIARNETALAITADEKLLLLREVHHRIKNNLQMISSIISIQRRKTADADVRLVLRSLQDRVLSIAAVDQSLYQNGNIADVRADELIRSITDRLIGVNLEAGHVVAVISDYDVVVLHADQIGPLSLLANEAVTNALKYVGASAGGPEFVRIVLKLDDGMVTFGVVNSVAPGLNGRALLPGRTGLGMPLIQAFSEQLGAICESTAHDSDQTFHLVVTFRASAPFAGPPTTIPA